MVPSKSSSHRTHSYHQGTQPGGDHKSVYLPPTKGLLALLPSVWVPYAELMRLDQPHGIYMSAWLCLVGLAYAASIQDPPTPMPAISRNAFFCLSWAFLGRSAGCAWNDNVDQDFDRKTARCRNRPIARGAVSTNQGYTFALALQLLAFAALRPLPSECSIMALVAAMLTLIYPFCKRFTHFAQVVLGCTLANIVLLSTYSIGLEALSPPHLVPSLCLSVVIVLLIVFYDVLYARPDTADDLKNGVKGMAVLFREHLPVLMRFLILSIASLTATIGYLSGMRPHFYLFSVFGTVLGLLITAASGLEWSGWLYAFAVANFAVGFVSEYMRRLS